MRIDVRLVASTRGVGDRQLFHLRGRPDQNRADLIFVFLQLRRDLAGYPLKFSREGANPITLIGKATELTPGMIAEIRRIAQNALG